MNLGISLPDLIDASEDLGRMIFGGTEKKTQKKYIVADGTNLLNYSIKPSVFLDTRNPMILSVNRISTLPTSDCHEIGVKHHKDKNMPSSSSYTGFAKINAGKVYEEECAIVKDDVGGSNPYHANVEYPCQKKEDCLVIASKLAFFSELVLHA